MTAGGGVWSLVFPPDLWRAVRRHLRSAARPGAGVVLVELAEGARGPRLLAREFLPARYGIDHVPGGPGGYHALSPEFVRDAALRARRFGLGYLAMHRGRDGGFTAVELASHERGYPSLLRIVGDLVGAVVLGRGAAAGDLWLPDGERAALDEVIVPARTVLRPRAAASGASPTAGDELDRVVAAMRVGIVGDSPAVDVLLDLLGRLGVRAFVIVGGGAGGTAGPPDRSGAVVVAESIGGSGAVRALERCDWMFLADGVARARYLVNEITHRCLIPAVELPAATGPTDPGGPVKSGGPASAFVGRARRRPRSRLLRPGRRCLWCSGRIDPSEVMGDRGVSPPPGEGVPWGGGSWEARRAFDAAGLFLAAVAGHPSARGRSQRGRGSRASRASCRMCVVARGRSPVGAHGCDSLVDPPVLGLAAVVQYNEQKDSYKE